jgi:hypothetical protein
MLRLHVSTLYADICLLWRDVLQLLFRKMQNYTNIERYFLHVKNWVDWESRIKIQPSSVLQKK